MPDCLKVTRPGSKTYGYAKSVFTLDRVIRDLVGGMPNATSPVGTKFEIEVVALDQKKYDMIFPPVFGSSNIGVRDPSAGENCPLCGKPCSEENWDEGECPHCQATLLDEEDACECCGDPNCLGECEDEGWEDDDLDEDD